MGLIRVMNLVFFFFKIGYPRVCPPVSGRVGVYPKLIFLAWVGSGNDSFGSGNDSFGSGFRLPAATALVNFDNKRFLVIFEHCVILFFVS